MIELGFDVISDLDLLPEDSFDWENKATSLYCLVAGNISTDVKKVIETLIHLSKFYHGVFYVPGSLEYVTAPNLRQRTEELASVSHYAKNVFMLHQNVVVVDGVALLGSCGWGDVEDDLSLRSRLINAARYEDFLYLKQAISKLQRYLDVKKIVIVTSAVPIDNLYFKEKPTNLGTQIPLNGVLSSDTEKKVTHWVFGSHSKIVDTTINDIHYLNNPYSDSSPYWPKRLSISI